MKMKTKMARVLGLLTLAVAGLGVIMNFSEVEAQRLPLVNSDASATLVSASSIQIISDDKEFDEMASTYGPGEGLKRARPVLALIGNLTAEELVDYLASRLVKFLNSPLVNDDLENNLFSAEQASYIVDFILFAQFAPDSASALQFPDLVNEEIHHYSLQYGEFNSLSPTLKVQFGTLLAGESVIAQVLLGLANAEIGLQVKTATAKLSSGIGGWFGIKEKVKDLWAISKFVLGAAKGLEKAGKLSRLGKVAFKIFKLGKSLFKWSPLGFVADAFLCSAENILDGIDMLMGGAFGGAGAACASGQPVSSVLSEFLGEAWDRLVDELQCLVSPF